MAESNVLDIVRGLAQAAANAYDGAHDERYSFDGKARKVGLKREEGDQILDRRVIDGFKIKFFNDQICIHYHGEVMLKDIYAGGFENEMARMLNEIKKFLQKEYKAITGNSVTLTKTGDPQIIAQSTSRVRSWVQAFQYYKVSGIKEDEMSLAKGSSARTVDDAVKKFLEMGRQQAKKPTNVTRKKD